MEIKDIITTVSVLIALISVVFAIYNSRKSIYINTITSARIKYLENIRNYIADFCSLAHSENKKTEESKNFESILKISFLIKLNLDKNHPFDKKVIEIINKIIDQLFIGQNDNLFNEINLLIELSQDITLLEWRGIKKEAMVGILGRKKKKDLVNNHLKY